MNGLAFSEQPGWSWTGQSGWPTVRLKWHAKCSSPEWTCHSELPGGSTADMLAGSAIGVREIYEPNFEPVALPSALRCRCDSPHLTRRELEIVMLLAAGLNNSRVASTLHMSPHTVSYHLRNIMQRSRS